MIRAVLFDFHNTLVSSDRWLQLEIHTLPREVLGMLARYGVLSGELLVPALLNRADELYKLVREEAKESGLEVSAFAGARRVFDQLELPAISGHTLLAAVEEAERACLDGSAIIPGAYAAASALRDRGLRLGVVSSAAYPDFVQWGLEKYDLASLFSVVATSAATGYYKSDPRLYQYALAQLHVRPEEAIHVGDHMRFDVLGAQRAGLRAIWYNPTGALADIASPDAIITSMEDLPDAFDSLNSKS